MKNTMINVIENTLIGLVLCFPFVSMFIFAFTFFKLF